MKKQNTAVTSTYNPFLEEETPVIPAPNPFNNQTSVKNEHRIFYLAVIAFLFSFASFALSGFKIQSSLHTQMVVVDINHIQSLDGDRTTVAHFDTLRGQS